VQFSLFWRRLNVSVLFLFFFFEVDLPSVVIAMLVSILKLKSRFVLCCFLLKKNKIDQRFRFSRKMNWRHLKVFPDFVVMVILYRFQCCFLKLYLLFCSFCMDLASFGSSYKIYMLQAL
jgi:hypothetical protein